MKNLFSDFVHGLLGCGGPETDVELDGGKYGETVKKPPVHAFSGNVTVPAGAALTIREGATVNDEAGVLGGGCGGAEPLIVTTTSTDGQLQASHTPAEIRVAVMSGRMVILNHDDMNFHLANADTWESVFFSFSPSRLFFRTVAVSQDGTATVGAWRMVEYT